MLQHTVLAWRNTAERREKIFSACQLIYKEQYVIDTPQVEGLLKPESLVPTVVCFETLRSNQNILLQSSRTHFRKGLVKQVLIFSSC